MTKKEHKKCELLPTKIADSHIASLGHGLCGSVRSIYNKNISQNTISACNHNDGSSHWLIKAINKSATSIQDLYHKTWLAPYQYFNLLSLTTGKKSNVSSNKSVTNMELKPNQQQFTTIYT
jgi:predicted component of type VI protein secretion system